MRQIVAHVSTWPTERPRPPFKPSRKTPAFKTPETVSSADTFEAVHAGPCSLAKAAPGCFPLLLLRQASQGEQLKETTARAQEFENSRGGCDLFSRETDTERERARRPATEQAQRREPARGGAHVRRPSPTAAAGAREGERCRLSDGRPSGGGGGTRLSSSEACET
ncbi:Hypothetical predicted protein [Podarcis lilfordi]|uniref:Uncharacterized protein n=1 Tax=Podarcis lilfordi TaxID=74358 RepID=A0AA35K5E3_9SAUR|nr:Hypothetical predicted protein [Podarcis lilfordi]